MTTVVVWLLISVSAGYYNEGTVTVLERFPSAGDCEYVRQRMPSAHASSRCVQAKIVVPK